MLGSSRQFLVIGPWRSKLPGILAAALHSTLAGGGGGQSPTHICKAEPVETEEESQRLLSLFSVGGAAVVGNQQYALLPLMDSISDVAKLIGGIDCIARDENGLLVGRNLESSVIASKLSGLGLGKHAESRRGLVLGGGVSARAAIVALTNLGFGHVYCADAPFSARLDRTAGEKLGVDISDSNGDSLCVEAVTGGLVHAWNMAASPENQIRQGDRIIEVNGAHGDVAKLLEQCGRNQVLDVRIVHKPSSSLPGIAVHDIEDLTSLASMPNVDVLVLADLPDEGCANMKGSQWLIPTLQRSQPLLIETSWPARSIRTATVGQALIESARSLSCTIIEVPELLLDRACAYTHAWTGMEVSRRSIAKSLLREFSKVQSPPTFLVEEVEGTAAVHPRPVY